LHVRTGCCLLPLSLSLSSMAQILRNHQKPSHVEYLPYHWLLVSSGSQGFLRWTDVSIGELVAERNAHSGPITAMRQNAWNAIMVRVVVVLYFVLLCLRFDRCTQRWPQAVHMGVLCLLPFNTPNLCVCALYSWLDTRKVQCRCGLPTWTNRP
jgi:hypothetical protein